MKLIEEIKIALDTFVKMKVACCKNNNGPQDLIPMLHFKYSHLNGYCGVLLPGGHPNETVVMAWEQIVQDGIPEFMIVMVEGYAKKNISTKYKRGEMEEDFKNNPESEVVEILNIHGIDMKTGDQADGLVSYKYNDKGLPDFDEPTYAPCTGESLKANMPMIFTSCRYATLATMNKAV